MSEALVARWSRLERYYLARIKVLEEALRRHADCSEAHSTGGICREDHADMIRETDAALSGEARKVTAKRKGRGK